MRKTEYMKKFGITLRSLTDDDRRSALTAEDRQASYIIEFSDGVKYYSNSGSLVDMMRLVDARGDSKKRLIIHHDALRDTITIKVEPEGYGAAEEFIHTSEAEAIRLYRYTYGLTGYHMQRVYI